jgi:hypothetical protein
MPQSEVNIEGVVADRGNTYGDYTVQAKIAQTLKDFFRECPGWGRLEFHQRESLDMIACKASRILNGDPNHLDSWVDIAGYATIVATRIPRGGIDKTTPPVL